MLSGNRRVQNDIFFLYDTDLFFSDIWVYSKEQECLSINRVDEGFFFLTLFNKDDTFLTEPSASLISPLNETDHNERG